MSSEKFAKLRKSIQDIVKNSPLKWDAVHSKKALYWLLQLKPEANETLQIAALAHDIERGKTGITEITHLKDYGDLKAFKKAHALRSADIAEELLIKFGYSSGDVQKVKKLIEHHEEGGDEETNILTDADSLAFFDYNLEPTYERNKKEHSDALERTANKVRFMYERMSPKAKDIVRHFKYSLPELNNIINQFN